MRLSVTPAVRLCLGLEVHLVKPYPFGLVVVRANDYYIAINIFRLATTFKPWGRSEISK